MRMGRMRRMVGSSLQLSKVSVVHKSPELIEADSRVIQLVDSSRASYARQEDGDCGSGDVSGAARSRCRIADIAIQVAYEAC